MANCRDVFGDYLGQRLIDISQEDEGEEPMLYLMFENGLCIKITFAGEDDLDIEDYDA